MLKLDRLSDLLDNMSTGVKALIYAGALIATLTGAWATGKAVLSVPAKVDSTNVRLSQHIVNQEVQTLILSKMLCIQEADHRHSDWTRCLDAAH